MVLVVLVVLVVAMVVVVVVVAALTEYGQRRTCTKLKKRGAAYEW
jgi:hypothetical protein